MTANCSTNTAIHQNSRHVQHYTNMIQDADRAKKCYVNTESISEFKNKDKPMVIDKEPNIINYFLPDPNQDNDQRVKRVSAEITQQLQRDLKDVFNEIGCFDGAFSLQLNQAANHIRCPQDVWPMHYKSLSKRS